MQATPPRALDVSKAAGAPVRAARMPSEDRRRQLLGVAVESFARNGFSGTKTRDIAAAAGVSEAILFRHFATKEDLYHAILDAKEADWRPARWFEELKALAARRDDRALVRRISKQIISSFREDAAFHRLVLYASLEGHLLADLFHERFGLPMGDFLNRYISQRQKEGAFRECDPSAASFFVIGSVLHYAMARYIFGAKKISPREDVMVEQLVELILGGLEQRPAGGRKPKGIRK
jgi:TetR/AcrR family transcriptional regulator